MLFAARRPASAAIWVVGIGWAADIVREVSDVLILAAIDPLRDVLIIFLLAWFLIRFISAVEGKWLTHYSSNDESTLDEPTVHAMAKLLRLAVMITTGTRGVASVGL